MKQLIPIFAIILFSCTTVKKAVNKVASTDEFTPAQKALLSTKCTAMFPTWEYISEGSTVTDSTAYYEFKKNLEKQLQEAGQDVDKLISIIDSKEQDNETLRQMLYDAQVKFEKLKAQKEILKQVPCPTQLKTDTTFRELTSKYQSIQGQLNQANIQIAKGEVDRAALSAQNEKYKDEINELSKGKWQDRGLWFLIGVGASIFAGLFLRLRKII